MIKKVVLEKSKRVERKFPEFDPKKIYVLDKELFEWSLTQVS